jgi:hypothetical protein
MDGLTFNGSGSNNALGCDGSSHEQIHHVYAVGTQWGIEASNITDFTISDSYVGDNWALGCGSAQHAIYLTSHVPASPSSNAFVYRNSLGRSCYNGLQVNGKFSNLIAEQNIAWANDVGGIAFLSGVGNSTVRSNLLFGNSQTGLNIFDYSSFCRAYDPTAMGTTCPYDQTGNLIENNTMYSTGSDPITGAASALSPAISTVNSVGYVLSATSHTIGTGSTSFTLASWSSGTAYVASDNTQDIVIYSGNFYVCLNSNTNSQPDINPGNWSLVAAVGAAFWANGNRIRVSSASNPTGIWMEGLVTSYSGTTLVINMDTTSGSGTHTDWQINLFPFANLGGNTFRNNILVTYSPGVTGNGYPQFRFDDTTYPSTSTFDHNLHYSLYPTAGTYTNVIQTIFEGTTTYYTCAQAVSGSGSTFGTFASCQNADPKFASASPSYWNTPASFSFRLAGGSPGVAAGSLTSLPTFDLTGSSFSVTTPALGSFQGSAATGSALSGLFKLIGNSVAK